MSSPSQWRTASGYAAMPRLNINMNELDPRQCFSKWLSDPPFYGIAAVALTLWIETDPERAWSFILLLIERAPNEHALQCVAAGPLEDLLGKHGATFIDRVEQAAKADQRFKHCLGIVWGDLRFDPEVHRRVKAARTAD